MKHQYWRDKWQANELGFHQEQTHPLLEKYWSQLGLAKGGRILVPLCGKSKDMLWIKAAGQAVVGAELSEIAVQAFFEENEIPVRQSRRNGFEQYASESITLLCGDFFALDESLIGQLDAVFDRAALIALPEDRRERYVAKLRQWLAPGTQLLLITVEYESGQINPPPFTVKEQEVRSLYGEWCDISILGHAGARLKDIDCLERAYLIEVREIESA